jgi:hypothetical protein
MNVLRGVLYFFASIFVAVPLVSVLVFGFGVFTALALAIGCVLAFFMYRAAQTFTVQASESQKVQLEQSYRSLAAQNGGVVPIGALMKATGQSKETVQQRMRELIGKGICELDFSPAGEVQYKLTPMDEARAQLAGMREKE